MKKLKEYEEKLNTHEEKIGTHGDVCPWQKYSREMKHRKAHWVVKYLKLKQSDPSIEFRELAY